MNHARQGDSVVGCGFDEARQAIVQLASFQAGWWDSPALERLEWMPSKEAETGLYQATYPGAWQSLIENAGDGMPRGLRRLGDRLRSEVPRIKSELNTSPRTIVHGDYRLDNCFFTDDALTRPPVVVVDWEFCVRGRGTCGRGHLHLRSLSRPTTQRGGVGSGPHISLRVDGQRRGRLLV